MRSKLCTQFTIYIFLYIFYPGNDVIYTFIYITCQSGENKATPPVEWKVPPVVVQKQIRNLAATATTTKQRV